MDLIHSGFISGFVKEALEYRKRVDAIVLDDKDRVLLEYDPKQKIWKFPGGGIDPDEDHLKAAIREVGEETGHKIEPIKLMSKKPFVATYETPKNYLGSMSYPVLGRIIKGEKSEYYGSEPDMYKSRFFNIDKVKDMLRKRLGSDFMPEFRSLDRGRLRMLDKLSRNTK